MAEQSVISPQTSYPESPDTSLQAYQNMLSSHGYRSNGFSRWWHSTFGDMPSYQQWRAERWDQYNSDLNAYNSYITSLAGQKAQAIEAGYNPAWLGSDPGGGTSPLDYQMVSDPSQQIPDAAAGFLGSMNGLISVYQAMQGVRSRSLQNDILEQDKRIKTAEADAAPLFFGGRAQLQGFKADWQNHW